MKLLEIINLVNHLATQYKCTPEEVKVTLKKHTPSKEKQCFDNAYKYVTKSTTSKYVIGYYLYQGQIPIEHAWVKDGDQYLEITLKNVDENDKYYKFAELDHDELFNVIDSCHNAPSLYDYFRFKNKKK